MKKLRKQTGASLVMAMVVFLISMLFSMALVTSALTVAQNADAQREQEQLSLSLRSAAAQVAAGVGEGSVLRVDSYATGEETEILSCTPSEDTPLLLALCDLVRTRDDPADAHTRTLRLVPMLKDVPADDEEKAALAAAESVLGAVRVDLSVTPDPFSYRVKASLTPVDGTLGWARTVLDFESQTSTDRHYETGADGALHRTGTEVTVTWKLRSVG